MKIYVSCLPLLIVSQRRGWQLNHCFEYLRSVSRDLINKYKFTPTGHGLS